MARRTARLAMVSLATAALMLTACGQIPQTATDPVAVPAPLTTPEVEPEAPPAPEPTPAESAPETTEPQPSPDPTEEPKAETTKPAQIAGPAIMRQGQSSDRIKELQARLAQIGWFNGPVTGNYGSQTTTAVAGFQAKRGLPSNGAVDQKTWDRLVGMTRKPTADELSNAPKPTKAPSSKAGTNQQGTKAANVDPRCMTGRVICISKKTNTLRWMNNGQVLMTMDVRFGTSEYPTREGTFSVQWKSRDHVSNLYHTSMPYALFFSGGQAVHYSPDFAARGYRGGSHGCVNLRNKSGAASLFNQARVGDKVVVYR